jgi:NADH-quinone oxidoreductase subunit G
MACSGGCIGGGGQPITRTNQQRAKRMEAIYEEDQSRLIRKAHENGEVKVLYKEYLQNVMSHRAHELLHTQYTIKRKNT